MVWFLFSYLKMKDGTSGRQHVPHAGLQIRTEQDMNRSIVECDMKSAMENDLYTEILPGIFCVSLTDTTIEQGVSCIKIYIIKGKPSVHEGHSLMIDTGFRQEDCHRKLQAALAALEIPVDQLDIFLTHRHHDHSGLAGSFASEGAHIFMNPAEERHPYDCLAYRVSEESLTAQKSVLRSTGITAERTPYAWEAFMKVSERVQQHGEWVLAILGFPYTALSAGDVFVYGDYHFSAYPLKGHTYGQMGLMDHEKKILFVADQLIHGVSPIVATTYPDEHLLEGMFASLRDIKEHYADWTIIPAHGEPIRDVAQDVDSIVYSYLSKSTSALDIMKGNAPEESASSAHGVPDAVKAPAVEAQRSIGSGAWTVHDIAKQLYHMDDDPTDEAAFFTYKMLITKTFSILEYLHDIGFVERTMRDGIYYWRATGQTEGKR